MEITTPGDLHIFFIPVLQRKTAWKRKTGCAGGRAAETMRINSKKGRKCAQGWREIALAPVP